MRPTRRSAIEEIHGIVARFELALDFPPAVEAEVQAHLAQPGLEDPGLVDLRSEPFVTVDGAGTRDLDQALLLEPGPRAGELAVHYALADASYYVRPGSALFAEGLRRGASFYLPGLSVPMLPRALSEGLISLNPQVDRRALLVSTVVDQAGEASGTTLHRALIRSQAKLTFEEVERFLGGDPALAARPFAPSLRLLRALGERRLARARARSRLAFEEREVEIGFADSERRVFCMIGEPRLGVERDNEQLSILINAEAARLLRAEGVGSEEARRQLQPIFRVHPPPEAETLREMLAHLEQIARAHGRGEELRPRQGESLADYLSRWPEGALRRAATRQAMVIQQRSLFSPAPGPHHGVGAEVYARFSAPMREIVGVFTHKEALERLGLEPPALSPAEDEALRLAVLEAGNRAKELQGRLTKEANRLVIDHLLGPELERPPGTRRRYAATVLGLRDNKLYLSLDEPPIELKLYADDLARALGEPVALDETGVSLGTASGRRFAIGDRLEVRVERLDRGRWVLAPA